MDKLAALLKNFSLSAGVFYTGTICGVHEFARDETRGHLHLIHHGAVQLTGPQFLPLQIEEPTLIFLPRPDTHKLIVDEVAGADVVCGTVCFDGGPHNPITDSLPDVVLVPLRKLNGVEQILGLMFDEAFAAQDGRQAVLDRLCEVLIVRLLRHCIATGEAQSGILAGLVDARLSALLLAIQEDPARDWTLNDMAKVAHMSRARFAVHFRQIISTTPADYLASWRIMLAQRLLRKGRPLKQIACDVGYGSASALTRSFTRKTGRSPMEWLQGHSEHA